MLDAIERRIKLENSHPFAKLEDKTQILIPKNKYTTDIYRTRLTHSYETSSVARIIGIKLGFDLIEELVNVSMEHDLGHPTNGHTGAEVINLICLEIGIPEGFSDNSQTFEVIKNNCIECSDYELASLIKYPSKLYPYQKEYLLPKLKIAIAKETETWGNSKRTVACEIMDIADRISYGTSDLVDSFNTGYTEKTLGDFLENLSNKVITNRLLHEVILNASFAAKNGSKRLVREAILRLKMAFINDLYWDKSIGALKAINKETFIALDDICNYTYTEFIKNEFVVEKRNESIEYLKIYFRYFLDNPDKMPSDFYKNKYYKSECKIDKLRAIRDMVADSTDQFVIKFAKKIKKEKRV